jgi:hypothetical protein
MKRQNAGPQGNPMKRRKFLKKSPAIAFGILLMLAQSACVWGGYGRLNRDPAVTNAFGQSQFSSGYRFYFIGRENQPNAILGIQEGYEFRSRFWTPVDPSSETFRKMVMVAHPYGFQRQDPYGAHILDANGKRIGIWYSTFDFTTIRVTEDGGVYVKDPYSPNDLLDPTNQ